MKRLIILLLMLLIAALSLGAYAEEEAIAEAVELPVPEEDFAIEGLDRETGYADFVGDAAVSASGEIAIDETNFPDAIFRGYVLDEIDTDGNGMLSQAEISEVQALSFYRENVTSLKGIEHFTFLTNLYCSYTGLTSLDLRGCTELRDVYCGSNKLVSLDVSGCAMLEKLACHDNALTSLKLDGCFALEELNCHINQLTSLDVSGRSSLIWLECHNNQLASLNIDGCTALENLTCEKNELTGLNVSKCARLGYLDCSENRFSSLDLSGCTRLTVVHCSSIQLTNLNVDGCVALEQMDCNHNQLTTLDVGSCTALVTLACHDNRLTSLDVSKCSRLEDLSCHANQLKSLKFGKSVEWLYCYGNQLTDLAVRGHAELRGLYCYSNRLKELDVRGCTRLGSLSCSDNGISSIDITDCERLRGVVQGKPITEKYEETGKVSALFVDDEDYFHLRIDPGVSVIADGKTLYGQPSAKDLSKAVVTVKAQTYTGKALKPAVTVKLGGKKLKKNRDYTVTYKDNKAIGKATVTVKGKGDYSGKAKATFKINPKKVSSLKLKAGKKKLTVSWKKVKGVTGYQVQYGLKKSFKGAKTATVKKAKTVKTTLKKLKSKKTYYVRIRAYKTVKGKNYYSSWSDAAKKKTK